MDKIRNHKNILSIVFIAVFFLLLLIVSEIVYSTNNDSVYLRRYLLEITKSYSKENNSYLALNSLFLATKLRINYQAKKYPNLVTNKSYNSYSNSILNSKYDMRPYTNYLKSLNIDSTFNSKDVDFLRIYYNLALIADKNNYTNDVLPFLKIAMFMEPELSHIHIEIANFYLLNNQFDKAEEQINSCIKLVSPAYHCSLYKNDQLINSATSGVGFLKDGVDKQYQ